MNESKKQVNTEQKQFYKDNGYVVLRNFFSAEEIQPLVEEYWKLVHETEESDQGRLKGKVIQRAGIASTIEAYQKHPYLEHLVGTARDLSENQVKFWYDQIIMKPAGQSATTPWHQDGGYWLDFPNARDHGITCWLALSEVTENHGCMEFIPGSHKQGLVNHEDASARSVIRGALEATVDESQAVKITMQPGDLSLHHCYTLHYTSGNSASSPRCGLVTHLSL